MSDIELITKKQAKEKLDFTKYAYKKGKLLEQNSCLDDALVMFIQGIRSSASLKDVIITDLSEKKEHEKFVKDLYQTMYNSLTGYWKCYFNYMTRDGRLCWILIYLLEKNKIILAEMFG